MRASLPKVQSVSQQIEVGKKIEVDNFERLIEGSDIGPEELLDKGLHNWYMSAEQALERGLIAAVV